jgi:xanthine dehydrogenase molybdopterin-binding subunit B
MKWHFADGTVLVISPGHDMGQGIATKAKQAAAYALGQALPESQRPFPLDLIHMADNSTDMLPNCGERLFLIPIACTNRK